MTETMVLNVDDMMFDRLREIREYGVKVAIDDFGTGHSSLGYLHTLPVHVLKIDSSFADRIPGDRAGGDITGAIVCFARKFGLILVVEGIEAASELDYLLARSAR